MLVDKNIADHFLEAYKALMQDLNQGVEPDTLEKYAQLRAQIYDYRDNQPHVYENALVPEWLNTINNAVFGDFVYLKKYQKGYVLQDVKTGVFYQVKALTTPLEDFLPDYMIVQTALMPFEGHWLCDGLINQKAVVGKNMAKDLRDAYAQAKKQKQVIG